MFLHSIRTAVLALAVIGTCGVASAQTSDELFDSTTLHEIRLVMSSRDLQSLKANYLANTVYPADLHWRDVHVRNVAVRSRGAGSRSAAKPGFQLDFNRYVSGQRFVGLKSLVLDNCLQDPAFVREQIAMKFFERMGLPAPRESFARLYVNDVFVGVYGVLETITPELLDRTMGQNDGYLFEYHYTGPFFGEYRGEDLSEYKPMFEPRTHQLESDTVLYTPIRNLFREVNEPDDAVWRDRVSEYVDLEQLVTYVAVETFLSEYDGILSATGMSNFYLYRLKGTNRHQFLPWDKDRTFSEYDWSVMLNVETNVLFSRALMYPDLRALYLQKLVDCARSALSQFWLDREIAKIAALIAPAVTEDTLKPYSDDEFTSAVSYLRTFARRRPFRVFQEVAKLRQSTP
jgi:spore coat protein CotH